nr:MAG TPA: hypothetical protein [Caudoviricetes sp.]
MENQEDKIVDENLNPSEEEKVTPEETPAPTEVTDPVEEEAKGKAETKDETKPADEEPVAPSAEEEKPEEEQHPEEPTEEKPTEEKPEVEDKAEEEKNIPEETTAPEGAIEQLDPVQEDLMAPLEELKTEKDEREALEACNIEVMKVEREFQDCSNKIAQALKDSFAQNGIDSSKTMEELKKEDPAKATLAMQFIAQAQELKAQLENAAVKEISKHQNEVIYRAASREFEKMGLNLEQAKEAVKTFKRIVNEIGVTDLKEDLQMKVQLAAGRAKIVVPEGMVTPEVKPTKAEGAAGDNTTEVKDSSPEIEGATKEVKEEKSKEVPPTPVVEKSSEPVVQKPKVEDFEEGVGGKGSSGAGTMINELNVLEELAKLPYKERVKFYKEHEDSIAKALSKRG